jgi:hypothetical protein
MSIPESSSAADARVVARCDAARESETRATRAAPRAVADGESTARLGRTARVLATHATRCLWGTGFRAWGVMLLLLLRGVVTADASMRLAAPHDV